MILMQQKNNWKKFAEQDVKELKFDKVRTHEDILD